MSPLGSNVGHEGASGNRAGALAVNACLFALSILLFALSHPNPIAVKGLPFVAYVAFVPLFLLIRRVSFRASVIWGGFYGLCSYCAYGFWLSSFHPLALYFLAGIYFVFFLFLVPALKLVDWAFPRYGYIAQWCVWLGYEYLKTLGFSGFSYGIIGYTQWNWPFVIGIASIFGVWGVSALVVFPSAWIAAALKECAFRRPFTVSRSRGAEWGRYLRSHALPLCLWLAALAGTLAYGSGAPRDWERARTVTLALVQNNSDPWTGGMNSYRANFRALTRLTEAALRAHPDIDLVVWPETAFIPRIDWHYRYREDREAFELVSDFLAWVDRLPVPLLTGNDDAEMGTSDDGSLDRVDYNAALLFTPGSDVLPPRPERYRKMRLVPFTEYFPYRAAFPRFNDLLLDNDTHFWAQGDEPVVFSCKGMRFSAPICFEDTFGYLSRDFVNHGARAIVNLANDAWSRSLTCQYQHLSMSVFRAVENRVPLVRATASGQTAIVDPAGRVRTMAEPFTETALVGDIPIVESSARTPYRMWGDLWGMLFAAGGALALLAGLLTKLKKMYDN